MTGEGAIGVRDLGSIRVGGGEGGEERRQAV